MTTGNRTRTRAGVLAGAMAMILAAAAQAQDLNFDIPAGDLVAALDAYSKQTGQQLVYLEKNLEGKKSPGARGAMTPEQALEALLAGTGLKVNKDASGAIAIFPAEAVAGGASTQTAGGEQKLEEVIVTATPISHLYVTSRSVSRLDTDPMLLPQSVSAVQGDLLYTQQVSNLTDVLNNVAGMEVGVFNDVQSRGFQVTAARNGTLDAGTQRVGVQLRPTVATQRVEVVKGPEQILQGAYAGIGGTVNVITKVPEPNDSAYIGTAVGSQSYWRLDGSLNGTLLGDEDNRLMGMVIGSFSDQGNGPKNVQGTSQNFVGTGLRWENTQTGTDLSVVYEYSDTSTGGNLQSATTGKSLHNGAKQYLWGATDSFYDKSENTVDVNFTQRIWGSWKLAVNYVWREQDSEYFNGPGFPSYADPSVIVAVQSGTPTGSTSNVAKIEIRGEFDTGPVNHKVLVAYDDSSNDYHVGVQTFYGEYSTDLETGIKTYAPFPEPSTYVPGNGSNDDTGVLLVDQLNWGKWHALLGVRWLSQQNSYKDLYTDDRSDSDSTLPQLGLVYAVNPDLSLYASASEGYNANLARYRDPDGNVLPDTTYTQAEGGVKALLFEQQMVLTIAAYQIKEKDTLEFLGYNPDTGEIYLTTIPGITSQGVEVEFSGQPVRGLQMRASFAGASAREDKSGDPPYKGYVPYKFGLWTQYWIGRNAGDGWWVGGGLDAWDAPVRSPGQVNLPGSTIVDLSAGYQGAHWSAIAGVKNVGNVETYVPYSGITLSGVGLAYPYPGREYRFDLSYQF